MAAKRRSRRITRPVKKRPAKKRVSSAAANVRGARKSAVTGSGMVETALAAFAHEVRTPLTGILAISNLLATSDLDERERRWVDTIKAGAEHLASLATLFVDAARSGGPGLEVRQDFFDLRTLARNAADSLTGRAAAKGLQSSVVISEKLPAFAIGDPVRLRAAVENLIDNAVKFTEQGSVTLQVAPLRSPKGKVAVAFEVSDSGIGLTLSEIKRLFRPFSQANVSIASRFGGAGLDCRRSSNWRAPWAAMSPRRNAVAAAPPLTFNVVMSAAATPARRPAMARHRSAQRGRCACSASRIIRSAASSPTCDPDRTRSPGRVRRSGRGGARAACDRRIRGGADGHGAKLGDQRYRSDHAHSRAFQPPLGRIPIIGISGRSEDEAARGPPAPISSGQACVPARPCDCAA
jgi:hypothetical protein